MLSSSARRIVFGRKGSSWPLSTPRPCTFLRISRRSRRPIRFLRSTAVVPMHGCATRTPKVETAFLGAAVNSVDILDAFLREIRPAFHLERFSASADDPESGHQLSG